MTTHEKAHRAVEGRSGMSAYVHGPGAGAAFEWHGARVVIKASGEDTGGCLAVMELTYPAGLEVPEHVHAGEDEMLYVLEGALSGFCGGAEWTAAPHGFVVTSRQPSRW